MFRLIKIYIEDIVRFTFTVSNDKYILKQGILVFTRSTINSLNVYFADDALDALKVL